MPSLRPDAVYLFSARTDAPPSEEAILSSYLSSSELDRADRFRFPRDRRRFAVATGWMRSVLGQIREEDPSALTFSFGDHGKPALPDGPAFNLSHSGDHVLLGVASRGRLGVDIEVVRPMDDVESLAKRHFSPDEIRELLAQTPENRLQAFLRGWTRKEAFIKGLGRGLAVALDSFSVTLAGGTGQTLLRTELEPEDQGDWVVQPIQVDPDVEAAIAWDQGLASVLDGAEIEA